MMTTSKKLITSDDPKGRQALDLFRGVYNMARLTKNQAQLLNENYCSEFTSELLKLIKKHAVNKENAYEAYSKYRGPKPIEEQIETIAKIFGLNPDKALQYAKNLPPLPKGAEGYFAIPKVSAVCKKSIFTFLSPSRQFCEAVKIAQKKLSDSRKFEGYYTSGIPSKNKNHRYLEAYYYSRHIVIYGSLGKLKQNLRTYNRLRDLESKQKGSILIIPAQFGKRLQNSFPSTIRKNVSDYYYPNEFGLDSFSISCMALTHPERFTENELLRVNCEGDNGYIPGSEYDNVIGEMYLDEGKLRLVLRDVDYILDNSCFPTGFSE